MRDHRKSPHPTKNENPHLSFLNLLDVNVRGHRVNAITVNVFDAIDVNALAPDEKCDFFRPLNSFIRPGFDPGAAEVTPENTVGGQGRPATTTRIGDVHEGKRELGLGGRGGPGGRCG